MAKIDSALNGGQAGGDATPAQPVAPDGGLIRDLPTQRRHGIVEATFEVRILPWTGGRFSK